MDELLGEMRAWVKRELAEWDRVARVRQEEAAAALDQKLDTMKAEWARYEIPWWNGTTHLREEEAAIVPEHKLETIESHSPITADVLRACRIDLVKEKVPPSQVGPAGARLQITLDELAALLTIPSHKLEDFTPLADPAKSDLLLAENPALYRIIRELAKRAMALENG